MAKLINYPSAAGWNDDYYKLVGMIFDESRDYAAQGAIELTAKLDIDGALFGFDRRAEQASKMFGHTVSDESLRQEVADREIRTAKFVGKLIGITATERQVLETILFFNITTDGAVAQCHLGADVEEQIRIAGIARRLWFEEYSRQYTMSIP